MTFVSFFYEISITKTLLLYFVAIMAQSREASWDFCVIFFCIDLQLLILTKIICGVKLNNIQRRMDEVALFVSSKNIGNVYPFPTKDAAILKQK